jgi:hypothetical protein
MLRSKSPNSFRWFVALGFASALFSQVASVSSATELDCPQHVVVPADIPAEIQVSGVRDAYGSPQADYYDGYFDGWQMFLDDFARDRIDLEQITAEDWKRVQATRRWFSARGRKDGYEHCRRRVLKLLAEAERDDLKTIAAKAIRRSFSDDREAEIFKLRPPRQVEVPMSVRLWRESDYPWSSYTHQDAADYTEHYLQGWYDCLRDYDHGKDLATATWAESIRKTEERRTQTGSAGKGRLSDEKPGTAGYEACKANLLELRKSYGEKKLRELVRQMTTY